MALLSGLGVVLLLRKKELKKKNMYIIIMLKKDNTEDHGTKAIVIPRLAMLLEHVGLLVHNFSL